MATAPTSNTLRREMHPERAGVLNEVAEELKNQEVPKSAEITRETEPAQRLEADLHAQTDPAQSAVTVNESAASERTVDAAEKSGFLLNVESILADGLGEAYINMDDQSKNAFRRKGEEVARKIEDIMYIGKAKLKEVLLWIKEWLRMIPGVNTFFLDQEAKIKTDQIFGLVV